MLRCHRKSWNVLYYLTLLKGYDDSVRAFAALNFSIIYILLSMFYIFFAADNVLLVLKYSDNIFKSINSTFVNNEKSFFYSFMTRAVVYLLLVTATILLQIEHVSNRSLKFCYIIFLIRGVIMMNFFFHCELFIYPVNVVSKCLVKIIRYIDRKVNKYSQLVENSIVETIFEFKLHLELLKGMINNVFIVTIILLLFGNLLPGIKCLFMLYVTLNEAIHARDKVITVIKTFINVLPSFFLIFEIFCTSSRATYHVSPVVFYNV